MLYSSLMNGLLAPTIADAASERLFFWFLVGTGVVMFICVVVEVCWNWRQERAFDRQREEKTPTEPREAAAADESRLGKA